MNRARMAGESYTDYRETITIQKKQLDAYLRGRFINEPKSGGESRSGQRKRKFSKKTGEKKAIE